jgi:hypothetical protein
VRRPHGRHLGARPHLGRREVHFSSDWYQADESIIKPMIKAAADKYAGEKKLTRRTPEDCQS